MAIKLHIIVYKLYFSNKSTFFISQLWIIIQFSSTFSKQDSKCTETQAKTSYVNANCVKNISVFLGVLFDDALQAEFYVIDIYIYTMFWIYSQII